MDALSLLSNPGLKVKNIPGLSVRTPSKKWQNPSQAYSGNTGAKNFSSAVNQANNRQSESAKAIAALQAEIAAMPRLPSFDFSANYAKAQGKAASTVNPEYQDKLNNYLKGKKLKINQQKALTGAAKKDIQTELSQLIEDVTLNRGRTEEDTANQLGDINANENSWQRQEGRQFDAARTALLGDVSNAGLTESGMGQNIVQDAVIDRNLASEDQVRDFDNKKRDTELFRSRTLDDLESTEERGRGAAKTRTEAEDRSLRDFIDMQNYEEEGQRLQLESERVSKINQATNSAYSNIVNDYVQALVGQGARPQDIEYFLKVYGR